MPYYRNISNHPILYKDIIIEPGSVKFISKSVMYEGLVVSSKPKRKRNRKPKQEVTNTIETSEIEETSKIKDNIPNISSDNGNDMVLIDTASL